jgi:lipoprotein-releasing system ATP-binding protein
VHQKHPPASVAIAIQNGFFKFKENLYQGIAKHLLIWQACKNQKIVTLHNMIETHHIFKTYNDTAILKDISFSLKPAEIVSIVGPSGAGKTTLLQILGTLDKPDNKPETRFTIDGTNMLSLSDSALSTFRNNTLGFVFQSHQLLPEFSAIENICIPALIKGKNQKEASKRAHELLDYFGLADRAKHRPTMLSGGEQQRVAVARALINTPRLLLADEPSGNLDAVAAVQLHDMFFDLRKTFAASIILVTHNKTLAARADRMLTLVDGQWN